MFILGVRIDRLSVTEWRLKIQDFLKGSDSHTLFTPNPEMLVEAYFDSHFKEVLNRSSLNICDGRGIQIFATEKIERIPGVFALLEMCHIAERTGKSVFLLGSESLGVREACREKIKEECPNLKVFVQKKECTIRSLKNKQIDFEKEEQDAVLEEIILAAPDILFVAFGHSKQEKWIDACLQEFPSVKIAMGVGGSFDFISGAVPRAPKIFQKLGFEWLFRLFLQPQKRMKRVWNATVVFSFLVLKERFHLKPKA